MQPYTVEVGPSMTRTITNVRYSHSRIPITIAKHYQRNKGPVPNGDAFLYSQNVGWIPVSDDRWKQDAPSPRGGITICEITSDGWVYQGQAMCSLADNFNYKKARQIAYGRAISDLIHDIPYAKAPNKA